jgi:transcriptional regulator with XRE-family HTH domain
MDYKHLDIGDRIRFLPKQAGLTLNQLAEMADIDGGFINCIENGKKTPSLRTLGKIARALNVSIADIFSEHDFKVKDVFDHQVSSQVRAILKGKPQQEREKFLAVLKTLQNKGILSAVFDILHTGNRGRRLVIKY